MYFYIFYLDNVYRVFYLYIHKNEVKSEMNWKTVAMGLVIGLLVGAGIGYLIARPAQTSQNTDSLTGNIIVKGSDTLLIVAQQWAETYMANHTQITISVAGGGSGVGFTALAQKTTDIADASREIKASEIETAKANGVNPVEW